MLFVGVGSHRRRFQHRQHDHEQDAVAECHIDGLPEHSWVAIARVERCALCHNNTARWDDSSPFHHPPAVHNGTAGRSLMLITRLQHRAGAEYGRRRHRKCAHATSLRDEELYGQNNMLRRRHVAASWRSQHRGWLTRILRDGPIVRERGVGCPRVPVYIQHRELSHAAGLARCVPHTSPHTSHHEL